MSPRKSPWASGLADHRAAIDEYVRAASALDSGAWLRPLGPHRWSPALITEHLRLSLEAMTDDAAGRTHMALRMNAWGRFLARRLFLPRLLRTGVFPAGARAPRETVPGPTPHPQDEALADLSQAAATLESTITSHPDPTRCRLTHPYFGKLALKTSLTLLAMHARHHLAQLPVRPPG